MSRKSLLIVSIVAVIIGGAALVFFDPLDLDLLGQKAAPAVAAPKAPPKAAATAAKPAVVAPKAPTAPIQANMPPAAPPPAAPSQTTAPAVAATVANSSVATPGQSPRPSTKPVEMIKAENKPSKPGKSASKPRMPKVADLRHCLELETNEAIAKCAGE